MSFEAPDSVPNRKARKKNNASVLLAPIFVGAGLLGVPALESRSFPREVPRHENVRADSAKGESGFFQFRGELLDNVTKEALLALQNMHLTYIQGSTENSSKFSHHDISRELLFKQGIPHGEGSVWIINLFSDSKPDMIATDEPRSFEARDVFGNYVVVTWEGDYRFLVKWYILPPLAGYKDEKDRLIKLDLGVVFGAEKNNKTVPLSLLRLPVVPEMNTNLPPIYPYRTYKNEGFRLSSGEIMPFAQGAAEAELMFGFAPGSVVKNIHFNEERTVNAFFSIIDPERITIHKYTIGAVRRGGAERSVASRLIGLHEALHSVVAELGLCDEKWQVFADSTNASNRNKKRKDRTRLTFLNEGKFYELRSDYLNGIGHSSDNGGELMVSVLGSFAASDARWRTVVEKKSQGFRSQYSQVGGELLAAMRRVDIQSARTHSKRSKLETSPAYQLIESRIKKLQ